MVRQQRRLRLAQGRLSGITVADPFGCSASQIVEDLEGGRFFERFLGAVSERYGFSRYTLRYWIASN